MKIKVVSDLHLEFSDIVINNDQNCDVLILSGDIMLADVLHDFPADYDNTTIQSKRHIQAIRFRDFLKYCSEDFPNVMYVAGNHEFYHGKFHQTLDILQEECAAFPNIHFLENKSVTIDDVTFVGGTLWTDCNNRDPLTMLALPNHMNDFHIIKNDRKSYKKLSTYDIVDRHAKTLEFIKVVVENSPKDRKIVVVGHHAPSDKSTAHAYRNEYIMNGGYRSNLDSIMLNNPNIVLWTHGHMHNISNYTIGNTRVICNPRGYESKDYAEMTNWDPNLVIEV